MQFKLKIHLTSHKKSHTDIKEWQCQECDKFFRTKKNLQNHEAMVHRDERPYKCQTCEKSFKDYSTLYKHSRRHEYSGEVYVCSVCKTAFRKVRFFEHFWFECCNWFLFLFQLRTFCAHMLRKHKMLMNEDNLIEVESMSDIEVAATVPS